MSVIRRRPRLFFLLAFCAYLLAGVTVSDVQSLEAPAADAGVCPAHLLRQPDPGSGALGLSILQGNAWMLPARPLLMPYAFSTDRMERLERLIGIVRSCRPDVVVLQELFERSMVALLARSLPDYRVLSSGASDFTGTLNASGLVTLTRLPVGNVHFMEFPALPAGAKTIERLARKGLLAVDVDVHGFQVRVVNLHLYAARDVGESEVTRRQLRAAVTFVEGAREAGRHVLVLGDFNLEPVEASRLFPRGWLPSEHGATYDPRSNRYTVEGSNNTPGNHEDRRFGRGTKTVDYLVNVSPSRASVQSEVLTGLELSDHHFLQHRVVVAGQ